MEYIFSYLIILLISFFIFFFFFSKLSIRSGINYNTNLILPPGPRKLPFIGNLLLFATSNQTTHHMLRDLAMKYGPLMHLKLGEVSTFVVSSPQIAKEIMKTHDISFASRPSLVASEIIGYGNTDLTFSPYNAYWRHLRKICTLDLLSAKRVRSFRHIREAEFSNVCKWIASKAGSPIDLSERVHETTYDIIARATLGQKTKEEGNFTTLMKEVLKLATGFEIVDLYPSIKLLRLISSSKIKLKKLHKQLDMFLEDIINEHKAKRISNINENKICEDLIDVLLGFHDDGLELPLTIDNIKAVLVNIFAGGSETSTTVVDWAMSEMLKNPSVMEKAQQEVRRVFDDKGYVDESKFSELKYLKCVISETLRIHPPVPMLLRSLNSEDCEINGYHVSRKSRVLVNVWAIGRDPDYWKDAESFIPERFLDNAVDYKGNNFEYIPFGAGRRMCPGIEFGLINVELPLAMFLYHFDWILPNGMKAEEMDMSDVSGMTVQRKDRLNVIPVVSRLLPF